MSDPQQVVKMEVDARYQAQLDNHTVKPTQLNTREDPVNLITLPNSLTASPLEDETEVSETPLPDPEVPEDGAAGCVSVREPLRHSIALARRKSLTRRQGLARRESLQRKQDTPLIALACRVSRRRLLRKCLTEFLHGRIWASSSGFDNSSHKGVCRNFCPGTVAMPRL